MAQISVSGSWTGKTDRGIGLGSPLEDFVQKYPEAREGVINTHFYSEHFTFDENQKLVSIDLCGNFNYCY